MSVVHPGEARRRQATVAIDDIDVATPEHLVRISPRRNVEVVLAPLGVARGTETPAHRSALHFYQRVVIDAATRVEAMAVWADLVRTKALSTLAGGTHRLVEARFGHFGDEVRMGGTGSAISWDPDALVAGAVAAGPTEGGPREITWEEAATHPGWGLLRWLMADPTGGRLATVATIVEAAWRSPAGAIAPLDDYLARYLQDAGRAADATPLDPSVSTGMSAAALDGLVARLERAVHRSVGGHPKNFAAAALHLSYLRLLQGRYDEAFSLRGLFSGPAQVLYGVWPLLGTLEASADPSSGVAKPAVLAQADALILEVVRTVDGDAEAAVVTHLLLLRDSIHRERALDGEAAAVRSARDHLVQLVNDYFYDRLTALPGVRDYIVEMELGA